MNQKDNLDAESLRLDEDVRREKNWKRWGPYLSERQWGTVREDYSTDGSSWDYFPHDHARSRAYRWGEDGLYEKLVARQAYAGLLWSKQFYHYGIKDWLEGDPSQPPPQRNSDIRNADWSHLYNRDVISMPDKWEYPWYATWDVAFHLVAFAKLDPDFAKQQLILFLREWYMHSNGQLPAYEFDFESPLSCRNCYFTGCRNFRFSGYSKSTRV